MVDRGREGIRNTVEFDFGKRFPRINMVDIHKFIRKLLAEAGIKEDSIYGIMAMLQAPSQVVRMKFSDDRVQDFQKFIRMYEGARKMNVMKSDVRVKIYDACLAVKFVRIGDAPFELPITEVMKALRGFGAIMDGRRDRYTGGDYVASYQGWITIQMVVNREIPSYIDIGEYRVIVKYQGQKLTCRQCGGVGHVVRECPELNDDIYDKEEETDPERQRELKMIEERKRAEEEEEKGKANEIADAEDENFDDAQGENETNEDDDGNENNEQGEGMALDVVVPDSLEPVDDNQEDLFESPEITTIPETPAISDTEIGAGMEMNYYYYNQSSLPSSPNKDEQRKRSYSDVTRGTEGSDSEGAGKVLPLKYVARDPQEDDEAETQEISQFPSPVTIQKDKNSKIPKPVSSSSKTGRSKERQKQ